MRTAITHATVITMDHERRILEDASIIIDADRIEAIGEAETLESQCSTCDKQIDGRQRVALPGFVNAHTHSNQILLRGLADEKPFLEFLNTVIYPVSAVLTPKLAISAAALSYLDALHSGTTCIIDNPTGEGSETTVDGIAKAMEETGIRGVIARTIRERTDRAIAWGIPEREFSTSPDLEIEITRRLAERWNGGRSGRVHVCPAPITVFLAKPETFIAAAQIADEFGVPVHTHIAEHKVALEATKEDYGRREVEHMAALKILGPRFHAVHAIWLDDFEIDMLAESGAHVIHCPVGNMARVAGVAPITTLLRRGVNVALGTDGINNHNHNLFNTLRCVGWLHKHSTGKVDAITAEKILELATLGGARALGRENELGSLEIGKKADLILINLDKSHLAPVHRVASAVVYGATPADVETVFVDGQPVLLAGVIQTLDEATLRAQVDAEGLQVIKAAGLAGS